MKNWSEIAKQWGWQVGVAIVAALCVGLGSNWRNGKTQTAAEVAAVRANVAEWLTEINDDQPVRVFRFKRPQEISDELYREKMAMEKSGQGFGDTKNATNGGSGSNIVYGVRKTPPKITATGGAISSPGQMVTGSYDATVENLTVTIGAGGPSDKLAPKPGDADFVGPMAKPAELLEPGKDAE